ncbi:hypothetical protein PGTUg99_006694 [Puccinia graminis f. sp. tritici]|uniref:Uncharacterized protein n=1 Tax=Puccinia graminis f. sp. tritici TaxID=56615 RepID=A0A5B0NAC3_PUCGR|nr:hypothetical protein PGTUg99_006694 [Puccinia graminis f. sp. tritici]
MLTGTEWELGVVQGTARFNRPRPYLRRRRRCRRIEYRPVIEGQRRQRVVRSYGLIAPVSPSSDRAPRLFLLPSRYPVPPYPIPLPFS